MRRVLASLAVIATPTRMSATNAFTKNKTEQVEDKTVLSEADAKIKANKDIVD